MKEIDYNINTLPKESKVKIDSIVSAGIPKNTAYNIFTKKDANGNGSLSQDELMQVISLEKLHKNKRRHYGRYLKYKLGKNLSCNKKKILSCRYLYLKCNNLCNGRPLWGFPRGNSYCPHPVACFSLLIHNYSGPISTILADGRN